MNGYSVARRGDGPVEIRDGGGTGGLTLAQAFRRAVLLAGWERNPSLPVEAGNPILRGDLRSDRHEQYYTRHGRIEGIDR